MVLLVLESIYSCHLAHPKNKSTPVPLVLPLVLIDSALHDVLRDIG